MGIADDLRGAFSDVSDVIRLIMDPPALTGPDALKIPTSTGNVTLAQYLDSLFEFPGRLYKVQMFNTVTYEFSDGTTGTTNWIDTAMDFLDVRTVYDDDGNAQEVVAHRGPLLVNDNATTSEIMDGFKRGGTKYNGTREYWDYFYEKWYEDPSHAQYNPTTGNWETPDSITWVNSSWQLFASPEDRWDHSDTGNPFYFISENWPGVASHNNVDLGWWINWTGLDDNLEEMIGLVGIEVYNLMNWLFEEGTDFLIDIVLPALDFLIQVVWKDIIRDGILKYIVWAIAFLLRVVLGIPSYMIGSSVVEKVVNNLNLKNVLQPSAAVATTLASVSDILNEENITTFSAVATSLGFDKAGEWLENALTSNSVEGWVDKLFSFSTEGQ